MFNKTFWLFTILLLGRLLPGTSAGLNQEVFSINKGNVAVNLQLIKPFGLTGDLARDISCRINYFCLNQHTGNTKPDESGKETQIKIKSKGTRDRNTQISHTDCIFSTIEYLGSVLFEKSLTNHLFLIRFSTWSGNGLPIRPPPNIC